MKKWCKNKRYGLWNRLSKAKDSITQGQPIVERR